MVLKGSDCFAGAQWALNFDFWAHTCITLVPLDNMNEKDEWTKIKLQNMNHQTGFKVALDIASLIHTTGV